MKRAQPAKAYTGLRGPFPFSKSSIEHEISNIVPGAFALGTIAENSFRVDYVGRSDTDLALQLLLLLNHSDRYRKFFHRDLTALEAYGKECQIFHEFQPPDNQAIHPKIIPGSSWSCPVCGSIT
jgi:hypothetical protein